MCEGKKLPTEDINGVKKNMEVGGLENRLYYKGKESDGIKPISQLKQEIIKSLWNVCAGITWKRAMQMSLRYISLSD
jgi:hypothetical protein